MDFLATYKEDIKAFVEALIELFKTIFSMFGAQDAEDGAEEAPEA